MNKELIEAKAQAIFKAESVFTHRRIVGHVSSAQWLSAEAANQLFGIRMREEVAGLDHETMVAVLDRYEELTPRLDKLREVVAQQVANSGY